MTGPGCGWLTWKLPRLARVQVDLDQRPLRGALVGRLLVEVVADQLLVAGVEPEPRRQCGLDLPQPHRSLATSLLTLARWPDKLLAHTS